VLGERWKLPSRKESKLRPDMSISSSFEPRKECARRSRQDRRYNESRSSEAVADYTVIRRQEELISMPYSFNAINVEIARAS
jgi:hypothetical protein